MNRVHVIQTVASIAERTGGPARTIRSLCESLARQGASVTLLARDDRADGVALLRPDPALVTTRLIAQRRAVLPKYDLAAAVADTPGRTILHDNGLWLPANLAAARAARRRGLPYVISPHGMLEPWALARHPWRKRLAWAAYQRHALAGAAGLVASSDVERASIRRRAGALPIAVIPNGVDIPPMLSLPLPDGGERILLFLSRLHPVKNLPGLVRAWATIAVDPRFMDWQLHIAGPDECGHRAEIAALIETLGLGSRTRLSGAVAEADKSTVFATADLFILPSHMESFGVAAAEALAHSVPVIASTGTPWTDLQARGCGWQSDPSPAALAATLAAAMILPPPALRAMGARGRDYVARSFAWDHIAEQTLGFYNWLLHGGRTLDFVDV